LSVADVVFPIVMFTSCLRRSRKGSLRSSEKSNDDDQRCWLVADDVNGAMAFL